jgi:hypothetical protein
MTTLLEPTYTPSHQAALACARTLARVVAALLVLTMFMGMVDAYGAAPLLRGPLADIHPHRDLVLLGALMRLMMSIGVIFIAVAFFPVARRYSETIAVSYLGLRVAEGVLLALGVCAHVILIGLSESFLAAGRPVSSHFHTLQISALSFTNTTYQIAMTVLGLAGTMQCSLLYRARLVPRWIAALGIAGYLLLFLSGPLDLVGAIDTMTGLGALMYVPGGLFELFFLPAWLFWKGFQMGNAVRTGDANP